MAKYSQSLISLLTQHDRRYERNPYALGHYFKAVEGYESDPNRELDPIGTLAKYFIRNHSGVFELAPVRRWVKLGAERVR